jgi:hypothetical protein
MSKFPELQEAIEMLENPHLVWSSDFEAIRYHLGALLVDESKSLAPHQSSIDLATELIDGYHNDMTVG